MPNAYAFPLFNVPISFELEETNVRSQVELTPETYREYLEQKNNIQIQSYKVEKQARSFDTEVIKPDVLLIIAEKN